MGKKQVRVRKADGNQPELVEQIRDLPGVKVVLTHVIGNGFPDCIISFRGFNYMCEIKNPSQPPSKRKLTPDEEEFHKNWTGQIAVIMTLDDVLEMIKK